MEYRIPTGANELVQLAAPIIFECADGSDVQLHACEAIRNNGEIVLTSEITCTPEVDDEETTP
jgi:hypothetical protein